MKKSFHITAAIICSFCFVSYGQSSFNCSGENVKSNFGSVSYSIGESFYVFKGADCKVNEGVQIGYVINPISTNASLRMSTYPNPTSDLVFFKVENLNFSNLSYLLFDAKGKLITKGRIVDTNSFISLKELPPSVYFLKCYRGLTEEVSFKIFKN